MEALHPDPRCIDRKLLVTGEGDMLCACSETSRCITGLSIDIENKPPVKKEAAVSFCVAGAKPSILMLFLNCLLPFRDCLKAVQHLLT